MALVVAVTVTQTRHDRNVQCLCGRFMTEARCHMALPAETIWFRMKCQGCGHWWWVDAATGELAKEPREPVLH